MDRNKFNASGCKDLTAYEAIGNIIKQEKVERFRPLIYICSPFRGETEINVNNARKYSKFAVQNGYIPLAPHLLFPQFMDDERSQERELAMFFNKVLLGKCYELWVFGENITEGMAEEIKVATLKNKKIRYFNAECEEVRK